MSVADRMLPRAGERDGDEPEPAGRATSAAGDPELLRDAVVAELAVLRAIVTGLDVAPARVRARAAAAAFGEPTPLDALAAALDLSEFERATLLLCAGPELVSAVAAELEERTGSPALTLGAALALLPGAHWSALAPGSPLRAWELVALEDPRSPAHSPLVVDERVLHHLVGVDGIDVRLAHLVTHVDDAGPSELPRPLARAAQELAHGWTTGTVVLEGAQIDNCRAVARAAARLSGVALHEVSAVDLPTEPADLARVVRLLEREHRLGRLGWLLMLDDVGDDVAGRVARICAGADGHLALCARERAPLTGTGAGGGGSRAVVHVPRLDLSARAELLQGALEEVAAPTTDVHLVAGVFDLSVPQARQAALDVASGIGLWQASRRRSQVDPGGIARRLSPRADWGDLVLPAAQTAQLDALVAAVRHRTLVLDTWGFADRSTRGFGTTALFAGASGTGKTLAAEVVAHELDLDLLHVDLSQVVSKYIGETEKNLGAVFDAAERGSAVLLFDEADTIFGKRSEVKDSHDRYANLEVGYLLQRMEQFRGLAILTTNAKGALDQAFLRRLHVVVTFPYPDVAARAEIWRRAFPPGTPTDGVDLAALAAVDVPGGAIAAAALTAAYLAAGRGGPVTTQHLKEAVAWELAKSGRTAATR